MLVSAYVEKGNAMKVRKATKDGEGAAAARERILGAALKLFSLKGYAGTTTREIAREAAVAEVTLFRHFTSKEQLLEAVLGWHSTLPVLKEILPMAVEMPYEEGLKLIASRFFDTLVKIKDWIRIMQEEVQHSPEKLHRVFHEFLDEIFETFAQFFREMQQRGVLRDFEPEFGARALHGMVFSYFNFEEVLMRKAYKPTDNERAIREFVAIFAKGTLK